MATKKTRQVENRNLLSSFFIVLLIGLAYQEMVGPVRDSLRSYGITLGTSMLVCIFFMTSIRFFIGNQLHLLNDAFIQMPGLVWLYDLVVIIIQSVILIFMGGDTTVEINRKAVIGFYELALALYSVDVLWVVSQWLLGKYLSGWKRDIIPWAWAILNTMLVVSMLVTKVVVKDIYSGLGLVALLVLNALAFVIDVILIDYYGAI